MNGGSSSSAAVESAKKACARLHQGYRDHRLYPVGHPTTRNTMELVRTAVDAHLDSVGTLNLRVTDSSLVFEGQEVYTHAESRDNLAFLMFRDGIRALSLTPGIEPGELETLIDCMARADQMVDTDQDLSTTLWERDLAHVQLEVVDPFLEGEGAGDEAFDQLRDTVLQRLSELGSVDKAEAEVTGTPGPAAEGSGGGMALGGQGTLDPDDLTLTEEEIARGEWLVSHPTDPLEDFVAVVFEILGNPSKLPGGRDAVLNSLSMVMARYLEDVDQVGLDVVLGELGALEAIGRLASGTVDRLFAEAATAERLGKMMSSAIALSPETAQGVERFLADMRSAIYPALLETLSISEDKVVRKTVLDILGAEGGIPSEHIYPLLSDPRWYVVRNAVQLAGASDDSDLVTQLAPLVGHPETRVRREVARSLAALDEAGCVPLLTRAIRDEDAAVRILAVRGLTRLGDDQQFPALKAQVESREFENRSAEELEAFLVAYGTLGGEKTVGALGKMWKRKMFGSRPMGLRIAALVALGEVGGPEADRALSEAMRNSDPQIQRTAARAMSELQARTKDATA